MTNTNTNVLPFKFEAKEVRAIILNGEPWFVASDVCESLELLGRSRNFLRMLDDDEKGAHNVSTPGGDQEVQIINESGLYSLTFKSRKPEAKRFKKWVTSEVLPAIRKHGRYEDGQGRMATLIGQTIGTDGFHMLGAVIKGKVTSLPLSIQRRATAKLWSQTHAAFGVRSAADIPADQLDSARNFIAAYEVKEGEYIQGPSKKEGIHLDRVETQHLYLLMSCFSAMHKYKRDMLQAARALDSRPLMAFFDQLQGGHSAFFNLDKRREEIYAQYTSFGMRGGYAMGSAA
jgi:prophage antirepressor-like protein